MTLRFILVLCTTFAMTLTALADNQKIEQWFDYERVSNPQISPDGEKIIYTRSYVDQLNDRFTGSLWIMDKDGNKNRQLADGSGAAWSPDGTRIALTKNAGADGTEIFVRWMDAEGATSQITHFEHTPRSLQWSPDGKWIAFRANIPGGSKWGVKLPPRPKGAKWTAEPRIIETRNYRRDRVGFLSGYDHLFIVPSNGGTAIQITDGEGWGIGGGGFDWTPDGSHIVFGGYTAPRNNDIPDQSFIYKVNVKSKEVTKLTNQMGSWGNPTISPDGKLVAYTGSAEFIDTFNTPEIRVIGIDGSNEHALVVDPSAPASRPWWDRNGRSIYVNINHRGDTDIFNIDMRGTLKRVTDGRHRFRVSSYSDKGIAAGTYSDPTGDGIIATTNVRGNGNIAQLVNVNEDIFMDTDHGKVEEINYKASDGTDVHGWLMYPPNFNPNKKYPLVLNIHGGPHGDYGNQFDFKFQDFAAHDFVVLYTNPRGSTSYGSAFAKAINGAYPGPFDMDDLMSGVDYAINQGFVDEDRLFVTGCSGGGILTAWIVGHTNRFKAAASLCPIVDWMGMEGTSDVIGWGEKMFKTKFWEDPTPWLEHSSMQFVGNVTTPTLLLTGENDMRTSPVEAERFYQALLREGVPTKLIYMRDEWHGTTSKPTNMLRTQMMLRKWFDEWDQKPNS